MAGLWWSVQVYPLMCEAQDQRLLNREVQVISRWEPTSQCCSSCGYRWGKVDLSIREVVREVVCLNCGIRHDRDDHAAKNIEAVGVGQTHDVKWTGRVCKTPVGAVLDELSTRQEVGLWAR